MAYVLIAMMASCWGMVVASRTTQAQTYDPPIAPRSNEAELAIGGFRIPAKMRAELFAAEPLVANPVVFCIDEQGRFYVAETFRQQKGVEDNRYHMSWLLDDLSLQTVEDRLEMFRKHLGDKVYEYEREHDRIRVVEDTDGDGVADRSTVFADGFNDILDGTGAGVLARGGDVYYTCIPRLWLLNDQNGDLQADTRQALHHGYGVRVAFRGHDMHGLIFGPDGRLYFSIGDRGYNVETKEGRKLARPDTGAVFRCEPDGSNLEVVAYGLRNPQELAFDDFGNLFTGDNNSDSGDEARWVHIVEGSDSGWRMYYQYLEDRGPWNREKLWHPAFSGQAAYIVPPITNISDGPSGLVAYPGVGLPKRYDGHFFLCDFRGTTALSGVRSFAVEPNGASFKLVDSHEFLWSILATDVDFGYDGSIYVSDWVNGWDGLGKGRIYRFTHEEAGKNELVANLPTLMSNGFGDLTDDRLGELLGHPDRRVRQEAQFELVDRSAVDLLRNLSKNGDNLRTRLHAIWGLGQLGRESTDDLVSVLELISDSELEVRAQAAKVCGEAQLQESYDPLIRLLDDPAARVRMYAALSLAKLGRESAVGPLLEMLARNADLDPVLRHAGVMGLVGSRNVSALRAAADHSSAAARVGAVLALRRLHDPGIALFLQDHNPAIVLEAARAIHDESIDEAWSDLAAVSVNDSADDALIRRVMNANFRLGQASGAGVITKIAVDRRYAESIRSEAMTELMEWTEPPPLDRVLGSWRPVSSDSRDTIETTVASIFPAILDHEDSIREQAINLAARYHLQKTTPLMRSVFHDENATVTVRVAALRALDGLRAPRMSETLHQAVGDDHARIRMAARRILAKSDPEGVVPALRQSLTVGEIIEQQGAISLLTDLEIAAADALLAEWLDKLMRRDVPPAIELDLLNSARKRSTTELLAKLDEFESRRGEGPLADYRECLEGGDASRGYDIFFGRSDASCRRCHKVGEEGGEVGPELTKIGADKKREYLLEAIVDPNKQIAKGFETAILITLDGMVKVGIVKEESETAVNLMTADGSVITVLKEDIDERAVGKSAMPEDIFKQLSKEDIRDLVEYMTSLKSAAAVQDAGHR